MTIRALLRLALAALAGLAAFPGAASAATLTYLGQTGRSRAFGSAPTLGSSGTTASIGHVAQVSDGELGSSEYYTARAEVYTTRDPTLLSVTGQASAAARPIDPFGGETASAYAEATATIQFALDQPAAIIMSTTGNVPFISLRDLGGTFEVDWTPDGVSLPSCTYPPTPLCTELEDALTSPTGGVLPAVTYELVYELFALQPITSCQVGCRKAGGTVSFAIVPEPSSLSLLGVGLAALAVLPLLPPPRRRA